MPEYWVKNYFAHGSFPEVGQKQKTEEKKKKKKEEEKRKKEVKTMASFARKHAWTNKMRI